MTNSKGSKTWGPSMSQQRERGFLPAFRPECLHNFKSAPNLDNKSRSTASTSTDNIPLGNSATALCDIAPVTASTASINIHHYTNTNFHSIYYERDLTRNNKNGGGGTVGDSVRDDEKRKTASFNSQSQNHSTESFEFDSDDSEHAAVGCFSFVHASSSSSDAKKIKNRYRKLPKVNNLSDLEGRQLLPKNDQRITQKPSSSSTSSSAVIPSSRKNSNDPKKKNLQFEEYSSPKAKFNVDLMFYKRFEQSLDALGDQEEELSEQDIIYITSKPSKNKLAMRLQKSLDAIDSYDIINDDGEEPERIYSKSIDDLSTGDYQFYRGGSQFTWECFLKNGTRKNGYEIKNRIESESSSQESNPRKSSWPGQY